MRKRSLFPLFSAIMPRPRRLWAYVTATSPIAFGRPPDRPCHAFATSSSDQPRLWSNQPLLRHGLYGQQLRASGHPLVSKMLTAQRRAFSLQRIDPEEEPLETPPRVVDKAPPASPASTTARNGERKTHRDFSEQLGMMAAFICATCWAAFWLEWSWFSPVVWVVVTVLVCAHRR